MHCVLIIVMERHLTLTSDHINNARNEFVRSANDYEWEMKKVHGSNTDNDEKVHTSDDDETALQITTALN